MVWVNSSQGRVCHNLCGSHTVVRLLSVRAILSFSFVFCFFSSRRRHTRCYRDWSSDVCSSDLMIRHTRCYRDWSQTCALPIDRKRKRLKSSHGSISYAVSLDRKNVVEGKR